MFSQKETASSVQQKIGQLFKVIDESPYLSRDQRQECVKNVKELTHKIETGNITLIQAETIIQDLDKQEAVAEIETLITKICQLNPSSPRISTLRTHLSQLQETLISPDQARDGLHKIMNGEKRN